MSKVFMTADLHLFHKNVILYDNRPFSSLEAMHNYIIKQWNKTVTKADKVFVLGDVSFGQLEETQAIISKLNGTKILIRGNHDKGHSDEWFRKCGFSKTIAFPIIYKDFYILSHQPVFMNCNMPYMNVHGHIHTNILNTNLFYNVGMMNHDYKPVNFEDIKNHVNKETISPTGLS